MKKLNETAEMLNSNNPSMPAYKIGHALNLLNHKDNARKRAFTRQGGAWDLRGGERVVPGIATLGSWSVVCFCHSRRAPMADIQRFVREMCTTFIHNGMVTLKSLISTNNKIIPLTLLHSLPFVDRRQQDYQHHSC
jgi:hypothetical protein